MRGDSALFEMKEMTSFCDWRVMRRDSVDVMQPLPSAHTHHHDPPAGETVVQVDLRLFQHLLPARLGAA